MSARPQGAGKADAVAEGEADWDGLKDDVGDLAGAAVEQGKQFLNSAKEQAASFADEHKNNAAELVSGFARSLRDATQGFDDRPNIRAFVDSAAGGLDDLADTIRERSFGEMVGEIEDAMRRRPITVAVAGLALGFLAARFIRASADDLRAETELRAEERRRQTRAAGARRRAARSRDEA